MVRGDVMIPFILETGIILFMVIQVVVAFVAVILAIRWKKSELLAGLSFLLIYTIIDLVGIAYSFMIPGEYIDFAQFGFILLAIIFFIIGMHPAWNGKILHKAPEDREKTGPATSVFTHLKKI